MSIDECRERGVPFWEVAAMAAHLPPESATMRALSPPQSWGIPEYLLAAAVDALHAANWQRGGGKGKRPKPIPRPGLEPEADTQTLGGKGSALPLDEMAAWLGWEINPS